MQESYKGGKTYQTIFLSGNISRNVYLFGKYQNNARYFMTLDS